MGGRFEKAVIVFTYGYLLRIPVLIGLTLMALPYFAVLGPGKPLLENLFVLTPWNIFWVMIVALNLTWSLLVVSRVVLLNTEERFGVKQAMTEDVLVLWHLLLSAVPAFSLLFFAGIERVHLFSWRGSWTWLAAAFGGFAIAYAAGFMGLLISITLAPRYHPDNPQYSAERRFQIPFFSLRDSCDGLTASD